MTNYINADGTSSDCCIYREIASPFSSPSFGVQRAAPYQRTDATTRRLQEAKGGRGRRRKAKRGQLERMKRRDEVDSPRKDAREEEYVE